MPEVLRPRPPLAAFYAMATPGQPQRPKSCQRFLSYFSPLEAFIPGQLIAFVFIITS